MGKQTKKAKRTAKKKADKERPPGVYRTTSRGVTVRCMPIGAMLERQEASIRESVDWPEPPTRTIVDVAGTEGVEALSQKYIEKDARATDEEKQEWADYQADDKKAQIAFRVKMSVALQRVIAIHGIEVVPAKLLKEWEADDQFMMMTTPDDPKERAMHWLDTRILGDVASDIVDIISGIYEASGYDKEVLSRAEASFRDSLGGTEGDTTGEDQGGAEDTEA